MHKRYTNKIIYTIPGEKESNLSLKLIVIKGKINQPGVNQLLLLINKTVKINKNPSKNFIEVCIKMEQCIILS